MRKPPDPITDFPTGAYVTGMEGDPFKGDPDFMTSLARGLDVIQVFTPQRRRLSVSQISQKTGIPRAAVRRCLYTLSKLGFVYAEDGKNFELRPRILTIGHAYLASAPLAKSSQPVLKHISQTLNESCSLATLDGDDILYIGRASTARIMTIDLDIGSRLPACSTSMGRVLLSYLPMDQLARYLKRVKPTPYTPYTLTRISALKAELEKVREQGFSLNDQELEIGLRSLAVPITGQEGHVVAALNVGANAGQVSTEVFMQRILPVLREGAQELSLLLR